MHSQAATRPAPPRSVWPIVNAALAVRLIFILFYQVNSDEPQHLHVVWGWTRGLVQYRDIFDNHFPLLHILFAPIFRFAPQSSDVFPFMRAAIAPFAIGCSIVLYFIGRR